MIATRILMKIWGCVALMRNLFTDRCLAQYVLRQRATKVGKNIRCNGIPSLIRHPEAQIRIGNDVQLCSRPTSNIFWLARPCRLVAYHKAIIDIADGVGMSGVTVVAYNGIEIGARTLIGAETMIVDTDCHPLDPEKRAASPCDGWKSKPITIGSDVFIGARAIILKGVTIGNDAIVGAGSVVTGNIGAGSVFAGNPAKQIGAVMGA